MKTTTDIITNTHLGAPSRRHGLHVFAAFAALSLCTAQLHGQLITSWEADEGFTLGDAPGNGSSPAPDEWYGTTSNDRQVITDTMVRTGSQSLALINTSGSTGWTRQSDNLSADIWSWNATGITSWIANPTAADEANNFVANGYITRMRVYFDTTAGSTAKELSVVLRYGDVIGDYRVSLSGSFSSESYDFTNNGILDLSTWNEWTIAFDFAEDTGSVLINGHHIVTDTMFSSARDPNNQVTGLRIESTGSGVGTTYIDDVAVIPEPAHVAAVIGGLVLLLAGLCRRRSNLG